MYYSLDHGTISQSFINILLQLFIFCLFIRVKIEGAIIVFSSSGLISLLGKSNYRMS